MLDKYDEHGNDVALTTYESYLSKFITENPQFYVDVFKKINQSIEKYINDNKGNAQFDRFLYLMFTDFTKVFSQYTNMDDLLNKEFNVQAHCRFHKQFFEMVFGFGKKAYPLPQGEHPSSTLSQAAQKIISSEQTLQEKLSNYLRPDEFFSPLGRSRIELEEEEVVFTQAPEDIRHYYSLPYENAQMRCRRNRQGNFSKWLSKYGLPFISGPSGTVEIVISHIIKLDTYSSLELKKYLMALAGAMVSRGHHSFAEILFMAKRLGFKVEESEPPFFYQQILTNEVLESPLYKEFQESHLINGTKSHTHC